MRKFKSVMAFLAVLCIAAAVIAFFVSAVMGNTYFMGYLYVAWIIPVLLWVFMRIAEIVGKYGSGAKDCYEVVNIEEPDFGCEGRPEGQTVLCKVVLKHKKTGEKRILEVSEQNLDEEGITEGDMVRAAERVLLKIAEK